MLLRLLFLFLTLTLTQPLICGEKEKSTTNKTSTSENSYFSGCFGKHPEEVVLLWIVAGIYSHYQSIQALIHRSYHGSEAQSFYNETPINASYELEITLNTRDVTGKNIPQGEIIYLADTKTFQNNNPDILIEEAHDFIKKWVQKNKNENLSITVSLKPSFITQRGKTFMLTPYYFTWEERKGVEQDLRRIFLISPTEDSPTQKTDRAIKHSVYAGLLFYLPLFLLFKGK